MTNDNLRNLLIRLGFDKKLSNEQLEDLKDALNKINQVIPMGEVNILQAVIGLYQMLCPRSLTIKSKPLQNN